MRFIGLLPVLFVVLALAVITKPVVAHPHSWIEMKTYIRGSETMITGFKMEWTFDAMTTAYMLDGEDLSPGHKAQTLQSIADDVLANMYFEHYFTYFYDGETPIRYQRGETAVFTMNRAKGVLTFELPLSKSQPVKSDSLKLLVFEPSYYVDMIWERSSDVVLSDALAKSCSIEVIEPNPTPEQMNYAMSLPKDADPDNTLGQLFTQTVKFYCQQQ